MPKPKPYKLSELADKDLEEIGDDTERKRNRAQRDKYIGRFERRLDFLSKGIMTGSTRPYLDKSLRVVLCGEHMMIYEDVGDSIHVLRVLHQNMDIAQHLSRDKEKQREREREIGREL